MLTMKALIWTGSEAKLVTSRPEPRLRDDYLLIKTIAVALNPGDGKTMLGAAENGLLGCDFAGIVLEIGSKVVKSFTKGDRVFGVAHGANSNNPEDGTFAETITVKGDTCMRIPDYMNFAKATALGVSCLTCGQGLFQEMKLRLPTVSEAPESLNESVLIYGGSSASGMLAIQYCKRAGYNVVTTCSLDNASLCKSLGADAIFDYHDTDCGQQIFDYTHGRLRLAWDTIGLDHSAEICMRALKDGSGARYGTILFNSISRPDVEYTGSLLFTFLGESFDAFGRNMPGQPEHFEFAKTFTRLTELLVASDKLRPPPVRMCSDGLAGILEGQKLIAGGQVRGCKLVYMIEDTP